MTSAKLFLAVIFAIYVAVIVIAFFKSKKVFTCLLLTFLQGLCALFAVKLLGQFIPVTLPVNGWTIAISSIGGISGVIMLLLCGAFLI